MKGCLCGARIALLKLAVAGTLLLGAAHADERDFYGVVTKVFDGDSFVVVPAGQVRNRRNEVGVRLMDIDAPEKDQPHADAARSALMKLIEGRRVFVDVVDVDRYQRKIAKVYREPDRLEIARALVHGGHVWVNRKHAQDRSLASLEDSAQSRRKGLWSLPHDERVPPWVFRAASRAKQVTMDN